jgi:hypothetical protein
LQIGNGGFLSILRPMSSRPRASSSAQIALVIAGVSFAIIWIAAHVVWASLSLMAGLMANDAGAASTNQHLTLIVGMLLGQALAALAGIPAGLAFFWRERRKRLLLAFGALFIAGALGQAWAFQSFFAGMPNHS